MTARPEGTGGWRNRLYWRLIDLTSAKYAFGAWLNRTFGL